MSDNSSSAFASQHVLGTESFIRHLVNEDLSTVEKILGKIQDLKESFVNSKNAATKKAAAFVKKAEQLYINALNEVGAKYVNGKVVMANKEDEEEPVVRYYKNSTQDDQETASIT